jgi:predicted nucleic acid-binding protein
VADRWVINASPIILLAKAEVIHVLPGLCEELVVPSGVVGEVENAHVTDAGKIWLEGEGKKFIRVSPAIHPALSSWSGGIGEAEVISWALQNTGFVAILDDSRARALARRNRVAVLGSLRVIVIAKERGFISEARPALERLRGAGAYITGELIDHAIELAGEIKS